MAFHLNGYSNFHDDNQDWIVSKIKSIEDTEAHTEELAEAAQNSADASQASAKTAATSEANAADSATASQLSAEAAENSAEAAANSASDAADTVENTLNQIALLQSRVDNIIPSGTQTEGNTELLDVRVAFDGFNYDSAGNSVRGQTSNIHSDVVNYNAGYKSFKGMGNFQHYGLNPDATFMTSQTYRVSNDDPITLPYAAKLNIKNGFKFGYIPVYDGTPGTWQGWYTSEITIPYGVSFVLQIAKVQENTGETANVEEFLSALYFNSVSDYLIKLTEKEKNADFYRTFNSFEHERGTINNDGSDDDSEYNMQRKIRSVGNVYLNKGDTITPTNSMRALAIGVDLVETSENINTGWFQTEYTIQYSGYYRIIISVVGDFVINDKDITKVCDYVELRTNLIEQMYNVYEYAKTNIPFGRKFEYSGEYLNLNKKSYDIREVLPVLPSQPSGGIALQAAEYYNGIMFLFYSGGVVTLMDYETGNIITSYETGTEHGNTACFSNVFYDSSDEFPLLYVGSDNANNDIYVIRVNRTGSQTIRKLRLPVDSAGYHASNCAVDNLNNILWTTGYYLNDYETEAGNYMKLCSWDLSKLTDNGDNTYTPELKEVTTLPFIDTTQDEKIMNGNLYIISSNPLAGAQGRKTRIYVVSLNGRRVTTVLENFNEPIRDHEVEGIAFIENDNKYIVALNVITGRRFELSF